MSSNANLSNLVASAGTLSPDFSPSILNYTLTLPNNVGDVTISATRQSMLSTVLPQSGTLIVSGLAAGQTKIVSLKVTAQDGFTFQYYKITVARVPSTSASLSSLTNSLGALNPPFSPGVTNYTLDLPNDVSSVSLDATVLDPSSTLNPASGNISVTGLVLGVAQVVHFIVTAQDGVTSSSYNITVTSVPSAVATLSSLSASTGTLTPPFSPGITNYVLNLPVGTNSATINASLSDPTATLSPPSGTVSVTGVAPGVDVGASVWVTAQDGITTNAYQITVHELQTQVVQFDNGFVNSSGSGLSTPTGDYHVFVFFDAATLSPYVGGNITKIRIYYPTAAYGDAYTISLYEGGAGPENGTIRYSGTPTVLPTGWNDVALPSPVPVGSGTDYYAGYVTPDSWWPMAWDDSNASTASHSFWNGSNGSDRNYLVRLVIEY